ncbi:MAG: flagellar hook-associated protein FlgL [Synergistaceae bacterium]|nr:flagellar hook-associated protein FlgL [Synergistaceae bacterium]
MPRVTNSMVQNLMLSDMHNNLSRLLDYQHQLATGKKHARPSDHPIDVTRELALQTTLLENTQYIRNQDDAMTWLANTDAAFNQMTDVAHRIRELTIYAGNGALGPGETEAIAAEIKELQEEMRNIANYSVEGRFLFSGLATGVRPFERDEQGNVVYNGNTGKVKYEVERSVVGDVSFHGREVFQQSYTTNTLSSVEVPIDFLWTGRDEIVQIKVGERAVKVHLSEDWTDRNINGNVDITDYNRFRDHGEVEGLTLDEIAKRINESMEMGDVDRLISVSVEKDETNGTQRLIFQSHTGEPIQVTSWPETDLAQQAQSIVGRDTTTIVPPWTPSAGTIRVFFPEGGEDVTLDISGLSPSDIATKISTVLGIEARTNVDGHRLVVSASKTGEQFSMELTGAARALFSTSTDDVVTVTSEESLRPVDHSHIDFATLMGMETTLKSRQFGDGETFAIGAGADLHLRFESGKNASELKIDGGDNLTIDELAERIRQVAGDWLEVVVQADETENGLGTSQSLEEMTKRLILRPKDNEPLVVIDKNTSNYAMDLGFSTAIQSNGGVHTGGVDTVFPDFLCLDENMAARLQITVGGKDFTVKLYPEDVAVNALVSPVVADQVKVMEQIVKQVNAAAGETMLAYTVLDSATGQTSLYAKNGEALRIVDLPIGDPSWTPSYTAGIALQMGIASGITSTAVQENVPVGPGTIRIESLGRIVDVDISAGDTPLAVADKIRKAAGSWLDVAYFDPKKSTDPATLSSEVRLNFAAKDGSPISIFDVSGSAAQSLNIDNAIRGDVDVTAWALSGTPADNILSIEVDGYTHTIDLNAIFDSNGGGIGIEDVTAAINARFQGQDVKAQLVDDTITGDKRLLLTSPRGYSVKIIAGVAQTALTGAGVIQTESRPPTASARYTQNIVVRTASDTTKTDFFGVLENLANSVTAEDREGLSNIMLGQIDEFIDNLLRCRTSGGAILKRYENNQARFKQNNVYVTELYSKISDIDLAETSTNFAMAQAVYQSSLAVIAKIVQPTLVDFLR